MENVLDYIMFKTSNHNKQLLETDMTNTQRYIVRNVSLFYIQIYAITFIFILTYIKMQANNLQLTLNLVYL